MKKTLYILLVLLIIPLINKGQGDPIYRNVYWVHGLGGDVNSLKTLSDYFRERYKINSYHMSYPSNRGVVEAAYQLSGLRIGIERNDDIVIAHSMGGLVSRQYYLDYPNRRFGGLMTINSPLQGAEFANSFDNGKIKAFFKKVTNDGLYGYNNMDAHVASTKFHQNVLNELHVFESLRESRQIISLIGVIAANVLGNSLVAWSLDVGINAFSSSTIKDYIKTLKDNVAAIISLAAVEVFGEKEEGWTYSKDDLKTGSQIITTLNNSSITCPRIAITGVANDPAGIRFLGSTLSLMNQDNPGIGDIDDGEFLKYVKAIIKDSYNCKDEYSRLYKLGSWFNFGLSNSYFSKKRDAFNRQAKFWENGFEREYQKCLGSIYYATETYTYTELVNICGDEMVKLARMPIIDEEEDCWQLITKTQTITVERMHPNDGIVVLPSQQGLPGATIKYIFGNDHEKAKRSWGTVTFIESQFDNNSSYFYTERK